MKSWILLKEEIDFFLKKPNWKKKVLEVDGKYNLWINANRNFHLN